MLTQDVLKKINNVHARLRIAMALGLTEQSVIRYIELNHSNLTKAKALEVIRELTGLSDSEILESDKVTA
jgi:hypothetical protein